MSKKLFLVRHAEAINNNLLEDVDRHLTEKGIADCKILANHLFSTNELPQLVIHSPSLRTCQTANYIFDNIKNHNVKRNAVNILYNAHHDQILEEISNVNNDYCNLMVIGHNPAIGDLFSFFIEDHIEFVGFSPAATACLKFNIDSWQNIKSKATLEWFYQPK